MGGSCLLTNPAGLFLLVADRLAPVCAPDLAGRLARPEDLAGETLLHLTSAADSWDHWGRHAGVAAVRKRGGHYVNAIAPMLELAKRGLGVALGYERLSAPLVEDGKLVRPFELWAPARDNYHLVLGDRARASPAARAFRDWILQKV